jgi:single-strand DNA-binding protein
MVNKVILIGNLGADVELRTTSGGQSVADIRLATERVWTGKDGSRKKETEWHRVVVWGKQADNAKEYLAKGSQIYLEGRLQTRQWEDRDGHKRFTTEVVAEFIKYLKTPDNAKKSNGAGTDAGKPADEPPPLGDDDIPF